MLRRPLKSMSVPGVIGSTRTAERSPLSNAAIACSPESRISGAFSKSPPDRDDCNAIDTTKSVMSKCQSSTSPSRMMETLSAPNGSA